MLLRTYRAGRDPKTFDGWLATGDSGSFGADGSLRVDGRMADVIVTGGEKVWPAAVEDALRTHPDVAEVAVAGRSDDEWGQRVVAWVVTTGDREPTLGELRDHVRSSLPAYAAPKQLVVVPELPKTAIGKIRHKLLTDGR
jgi:acyl-coenzyme A synthetase/AMP-(fatty) acid ligase